MRGIIRNNSIYDFAFKQIRATMGGAVKFILTGSAPVSPEILHFLRVVTGCIVIEGYGATETGGACSIQLPGETTVGNIGPPFLCSMFKLADVPEMNLVASRDNRGEILVHGTNVFKGYFKDEEKTKAALDADGWYHTGDVGSYDENGCMRVVDRVKNIFKLQQGEYIAPEKIENIYVRSKYVAQVFIYGNSYKSSLIAIIVPEETVLAEWAQQNGQEADFKKLCANAELKKLVLKDITSLGKEAGLKGMLHSIIDTIPNIFFIEIFNSVFRFRTSTRYIFEPRTFQHRKRSSNAHNESETRRTTKAFPSRDRCHVQRHRINIIYSNRNRSSKTKPIHITKNNYNYTP